MEEKIALAATAIVLMAIAFYGATTGFDVMSNTLAPWYDPVVKLDEVALAEWSNENIPHNTLFAGDLFACEMLTATARAICTVGGAWELADNANTRFFENEKAFTANSSKESWEIFKKYRATYVLVHPRQAFYGYGYKQPHNENFEEKKYFELVKQIGQAKLYQVL